MWEIIFSFSFVDYWRLDWIEDSSEVLVMKYGHFALHLAKIMPGKSGYGLAPRLLVSVVQELALDIPSYVSDEIFQTQRCEMLFWHSRMYLAEGGTWDVWAPCNSAVWCFLLTFFCSPMGGNIKRAVLLINSMAWVSSPYSFWLFSFVTSLFLFHSRYSTSGPYTNPWPGSANNHFLV